MGYRDELIRRLEQDGLWDQLTVEQQERFRSLTEEQSRQMMVMDDQWGMGEREAVELFGLMSLVNMLGAFNGALVERAGEDIGKLSEAGRLLAEFFIQLRQRGMSSDQVQEGLQELSPLVIAALLAAYKGPAE